MKDPAFLFYSNDFLSGVADLTMDERGQYITLLCLQHQKGHLTEKMIRLCCGNATADVLAKFRQDENGLFFNQRLEIEVDKRKAHGEKQRTRAIEGWKKRKNINVEDDATAYATAMPLVNENENENEDKDVSVNKTMRKKFVKPTEEELYNYIGEVNAKGNNFIDDARVLNLARTFIDYYESNGWICGRAAMRSWQSTVNNWMRREWESIKQKSKQYGNKSNSTTDSIAKAEQLYRDALAISNARDQARQDSTTA